MSTTSTAAPALTRVLAQGKFETIAMLKTVSSSC